MVNRHFSPPIERICLGLCSKPFKQIQVGKSIMHVGKCTVRPMDPVALLKHLGSFTIPRNHSQICAEWDWNMYLHLP